VLRLKQLCSTITPAIIMPKQQRVLYSNDARHFYLFAHEPPMAMEDAWRCVDDVAGTSVDTFVYMVQRGDGLFYPSKVGRQFGSDMVDSGFWLVAFYRAWHNMKSLEARGLDPLTVVIDRAHEKQMEFIASYRVTSYLGLEELLEFKRSDTDGALNQPLAPGALSIPELRAHQLAVLTELMTSYACDGLELDFGMLTPDNALPPGMTSEELGPVLTEWIATISAMTRENGGVLGARVFPTAVGNMQMGLDVMTWIKLGLVDYLMPYKYGYFQNDCQPPIEWLIKACADTDISVYGYCSANPDGLPAAEPNRPLGNPIESRGVVSSESAAIRACAANLWNMGVDGLMTWFARWPHGDIERAWMGQIGDADLLSESSKVYSVLAEALADPARLQGLPAADFVGEAGYALQLPRELRSSGVPATVELIIADDVSGAKAERLLSVRLDLVISNLMAADQLSIELNGCSLEHAPLQRTYENASYSGQRLSFDLLAMAETRPVHGSNTLVVALRGRPPSMADKGVALMRVECRVDYGDRFASKL
jgi:hypothetical protein